MGCALSSPVELIRVQRHGSANFRCAVAEMQGWRVGHEDAHAMHCDGSRATCFVLDGHGGDGAALFSAPQLLEELKNTDSSMPTDQQLEQVFYKVDERLHSYVQENPDKDSGSTVVGAVCVRSGDGTYSVKLLNCGDSRAVIARGPKEEEDSCAKVQIRRPQHLEALGAQGLGNAVKSELEEAPGLIAPAPPGAPVFPVVMETIDHKPDHPTEKFRIEAAGGSVTTMEDPPRLDGSLAVSRGLGDFEYKGDGQRLASEQKVSCVPDIYEIPSLQPGSICVLACDGVWDVMTAEDVAEYVREEVSREPPVDLGDVAAELLRLCLKKNSRDNMTCMILQLEDGTDWAGFPDEMQNYDKLLERHDQDEDVQSHYSTFLQVAKFPAQALSCDVCKRWLLQMNQCQCKQVFYCSRICQKKGWKAHQVVCGAKTDSAGTKHCRPAQDGV
ncbi:PPM1B [Symbiodinium natans]|uniref:PPM1B protein n=1 Tax=Symbiodinium natans TaxID=878477 RepID=A0A812QWD6_9DINO|nr:PPM1B [Symbiodinium natans]